ncbi:hypothetical protein [Nonlabens antarcticus]|uniref:hypothetical protein n=1 Tax=Nonlabens antarcticus TaxID=392714 RepID=UPI001891055A|nr:hypothetical protein [Nonlabens antarcticus]
MEIKAAIKLGINIVITLIALLCFQTNAQISEPVHLSYNIDNTQKTKLKKIVQKNGEVHFYIDRQHFIFNPEDAQVLSMNTSGIKQDIIQISTFENLAHKERIRLVKEGDASNSVKILFNDEVFNTIYLYENICDSLTNRYSVQWIEEIE